MASSAKVAAVYTDAHFDPLTYVSDHVPPFDMADSSTCFCDLSAVIRRLQTWRDRFPRVQPIYVVNSNCDHMILKLMIDAGALFNCASRGEVEDMIARQVPPTRILLYNAINSIPDLRFARSIGVDLLCSIDSVGELQKINKHFPEARLLLRVCCHHRRSATTGFEKPLGCKAAEVPTLLALAKELNLRVVGLSLSVVESDPVRLTEAIATARQYFRLAKELGHVMTVLNIGDADFDLKYATAVDDALALFFPEDSVRVLAEPSRYFTATAMTIFATVQAVRSLQDGDKPPVVQYFINDGKFNSFRKVPKCMPNSRVLWLRRTSSANHDKEASQTALSKIFGPTCDADDIVAQDLYMPVLSNGDLIYFTNVGAHSITTNSNFNGFAGATVKYFVHRADYQKIFSL